MSCPLYLDVKSLAEQRGLTMHELLTEFCEADEVDTDVEFAQYLDDEGSVDIGGYKFFPSYALKELDPTAYYCSQDEYISFMIDDEQYFEDDQECYWPRAEVEAMVEWLQEQETN